MQVDFSRVALQGLLDAGVNLCALWLPAKADTAASTPLLQTPPPRLANVLPVLTPHRQRTILHLAWEHGVPAYAIGRLNTPDVQSHLQALDVDVACVACFPQRIPPALLAIPRRGFLNLHPSLLPALRGPAPLFWTFRQGLLDTGVTIHKMDRGLDTGAIALQRPLQLTEGISGPEANHLLAAAGGRLLVRAMEHLAKGTLHFHPQPLANASTFSWPQADDFRIPTQWPARRAFIFMRGTAHWEQPYWVHSPDDAVSIREAVAYDACAKQSVPFQRNGRDVTIQFTPGVLHAR